MTSYKSEVDLFTTRGEGSPRKRTKPMVFVHQNNSDIDVGLEMIGYVIIRPRVNNIVQSTMNIAKSGRKNGIKLYIVDCMVVDKGELQSPFSLIGYIRVYDPYTPILALSYDTSPESVQAAFRYGATSYLTRPQDLDLIAAVMEGLIANGILEQEAQEILGSRDSVKVVNNTTEMIKISDSLFLDYMGKRLAFLDNDGVFTFSEELPQNIISVLHCLVINAGKRLSAVSIGRLLGDVQEGMNWHDERTVVDRVTKQLSSVRNVLAKYDKYKTVKITRVRRYGTTLEVVPPNEDAVREYAQKKKLEKESGAIVKAGFNLVSLMDENNTVKTKGNNITLEELL